MFPYLDSVARRYSPVIVWAVIGMNVVAFLYQTSLPPRVLASREQAGEASDPGPVGGPPEVAHHQRDESDASLLTRDRPLPSPL